MKKYIPRYSDPRVRNKCLKAIVFVKKYLDPLEARPCSQSQINKHLGRGNDDLGRFLRQQLLRTENNTWSIDQHRCKTYTLRLQGITEITQAMNPADKDSVCYLQRGDQVRMFLSPEQQHQLETAKFDYEDKSHRLWNDIQNIPTVFREPILAEFGYCHQYDIETAAPRLLSQLAQHRRPCEHWRYIPEYLAHKQKIREQLCLDTGATAHQIKQVITGLFAGARIGRNLRFSLIQKLELDLDTADRICKHAWIRSLRSEIRELWQIIGTDMPRTYKPTKTGQVRARPIESRRKWAIYFRLEREVMNSITQYLTQINQEFFIEHDGWVSRQSVNTQDLIQHVVTQTGYQVQFSYKQLRKCS